MRLLTLVPSLRLLSIKSTHLTNCQLLSIRLELRALVIASPSNRSIAIYGPKLIGVSFVAGPDLKLLAIYVISVWYIETFIAKDTNLRDRTGCGSLDASTLHNCPRLVRPVEGGIGYDNDICTIVISACLNEGSKLGYNECQFGVALCPSR
jgi:hypothetical protein